MPPRFASPTFQLSGLGTQYLIYVETFAGVDASGPWPVVICLDGDDQFATLCSARKKLAAKQPLPPLLLVGIGYGASYREPGNQRVRDYTSSAIEGAPQAGGADAFLEFIINTLWPELERRYPIHPTVRGIAGHSLGALFALHALFKPQPFFNRVLASAPSLWWDERILLKQAADLRATQASLPASLFLSVGGKDSDSMVSDLDMLETQLNGNPFDELVISPALFPEHNHFNAVGVGFRSGLAALFSQD